MAIPILKAVKETDIAKFYDNLVERFKATPEAVDASSQEALEARWKALGGIFDSFNKPVCSVLDIGAGWGYGAKHLTDLSYSKNFGLQYTGIDISPKMIEAAKEKYPNGDFICADLADYKPKKKFDIVLAQGIFYLLPINKQGFQKVMDLIKKMVDLANEAVAFTAVCSRPFGHSDKELRIEPHSMIDFLGTISPFITMRMDYWPGDSCWYLYKEKQ